MRAAAGYDVPTADDCALNKANFGERSIAHTRGALRTKAPTLFPSARSPLFPLGRLLLQHVRWVEYLRDADAEVLVENQHLTTGNHPFVHVDIQWIAGKPFELDDGPLTEA